MLLPARADERPKHRRSMPDGGDAGETTLLCFVFVDWRRYLLKPAMTAPHGNGSSNLVVAAPMCMPRLLTGVRGLAPALPTTSPTSPITQFKHFRAQRLGSELTSVDGDLPKTKMTSPADPSKELPDVNLGFVTKHCIWMKMLQL
ncbi:hypothetical protein PIB30_019453 [Stylosanthes scabra]|uniref:Uncharacterized protein n=1 Tax=Stylosanthes scabra TaxID=79078 RepID=A0ABU6S8I2_9FABA|nr:hypothetical protein [Stylosanthes scabra]